MDHADARQPRQRSADEPTLDADIVRTLIRTLALAGPLAIHFVPDALPALWHSRAAIVASGTATVEAAMMSTPFVMVYRV